MFKNTTKDDMNSIQQLQAFAREQISLSLAPRFK